MNKNVKWSLVVIAIAVAAVLIAAAVSGGDPEAPKTASERDERLVRSDSPRLTNGTKATFVEFLDFECEACGALYPTIENLKARYGDRVAFVVRYMPLHVSSMNAARAAEAAGVQGKYEAMYDVLFQKQAEWGHQNSPEEAKFFGYAQQLGLDMTKFRADYDDPAVRDRIEQSEVDARSLGVTGTPTMFMNGVRLEPKTIADLTAAFDAALAG